MAWYYDLVVLAILALCVWNGMRKGVSRSLLQTAATILSAVVALWVSQPLAELCYTEFLEKPVVSAVEGQLNTVDVVGLVQTALSDNGIPVSREQVQSMLADPEGTAAQYGFDSGNRGNNALFHRGNDSKNVSIPVALRIEKITGRYFIHRQKLAER